MTEHTHSEFFSTPPIESLPDDIRIRLEDIQERSGFLPNIFVAMARRPDEFRAFFNYHDVLCLLYTSPSPRDVEESRMPSSA